MKSISALALITMLLIMLAPMLFFISLVLSLHPRMRTAFHALLFLYGFIALEWSGLFLLGTAWLTHKDPDALLERYRQIQLWWAFKLLRLGQRLYSLSIEITGQESIEGPCALVLPRHTSLGDTVLPLIFFGKARDENLRYVLKRELLIFPCLDIGGNRLPNVFVDRSGANTDHELDSLRDLMRTASSNESVLIYPEGTRSTVRKREQLLAKRPKLADQLDRWPDLLPPRIGGPSAMLEVNPGKDVVFMAHTGFEGSASVKDLISGGWRKQHIRIHFWRIPYEQIPDDHRAFLYEQWDRMQQTVAELRAA